ncbi:MAG TPA: hypothetical protein VNY10_03490 [Roseiarcus sp.]|jgi:hypothetical protein|nr:hypothetical protein [Roseiarcus sp.]
MDRRRDDRNSPAKIADWSDEQRFAFRAWRRVRQRPGFVLAAVIVGLAAGLANRALFDPAGENNLANFLRSAAHGRSVGLTAWAVQTAFDSRVRSRLGAALSQLPLAAEIAVRALVMTAALIVVGILLQFILYAAPLRLHWVTQEWLVSRRRGSRR